jgi:maltose alpha-D-glucosyltransferase/alpha-amylase
VLAEANVLPETDMEYFGADGDRMHMMFNFQINQNLFYALASSARRVRSPKTFARAEEPWVPQGSFF